LALEKGISGCGCDAIFLMHPKNMFISPLLNRSKPDINLITAFFNAQESFPKFRRLA